ncbi:MAG: peptidase U32 family protein, partial [Candidatus Cloacimonadaceae bacterium]
MEIAAPGGDLEKIKYAVLYGADAVYTGFKDFGLRAGATNLSRDELKEAIRFVHKHGAKLYLTLNAYLENDDFPALKDFVSWLNTTGLDAVIVSDPGVLSIVKEHSDIAIHISTQANVNNLEAARFWHRQGAKRIVLAREMKLKDIRQIKEALPELELECFIHGAM